MAASCAELQKKVVILGGGTAGWIAAAMLSSAFNRPGNATVGITVIETAADRADIDDGTSPTFQSLLRGLKIDEHHFMAKTDATFKHGVKLTDWLHEPGNERESKRGHSFYNPFEAPQKYEGAPLSREWAMRYDRGDHIGSFAHACGFQADLMDDCKAPKRLEHGDYVSGVSYAYHLDTSKLADYMADIATGRGVVRLRDSVTRADLDERGWIAGLEMVEHGRIEADLYIDCSGFRGQLINQALGVPFQSLTDILLCDRVVSLRLPYRAGEKVKPYTDAVAKAQGWLWGIGLQSARSAGYVYSSKFISDDDAETALRGFCGPSAGDQAARHVPMRIGIGQEFWKNNCVAIGQAGSFLDPLEATGIYTIESACRLLIEFFPFGESTPALTRRYNDSMRRTVLEMLDFVNLHYCLSKRRDSEFWKAATSDGAISDSLRERLELWSRRPPSNFDTAAALTTYAPGNWESILYGMGWRPDHWGGRHSLQGIGDADSIFAMVRKASLRAREDLPDHSAYLRQLRN